MREFTQKMSIMNYADMSPRYKAIYDKMAKEIYEIPGASVYDGKEPYIELRLDDYKYKAKIILDKYGYGVKEEEYSEGSDYNAYYIWFIRTKPCN